MEFMSEKSADIASSNKKALLEKNGNKILGTYLVNISSHYQNAYKNQLGS